MPAKQFQPDPQQEALEWFSRLRQPGCDEGERQVFAAWCQVPQNAQAYAELETFWQQLQPAPARPQPRQLTARRSHLGKWLALVFLLVMGTLAYLYWPLMQRLGSEMHTDVGERRSLRLADGSTVHLDSASAMNVDLRGRTRQLHLVQGQVYLEVLLDGRAMEVDVGDARIQVFGTRLQIARFADHNELVVLSGKAMVVQGGEQRLVSAGERVTFDATRIDPVQKADMKTADSWRNGRLRATDMPLGQVLERLAGYQGQRLWMLDEQAAHRRVSGDFSLDRPAESLAALASTQQLQLQGVLDHWLIVR
ncbi:FecR domain-containing protein [Pseudomonas sp. 17391]|uniref:FecR family protein n=1 Tax=Pseudomonas TaxID=286 RepID=UPI00053434B4|nr:MULTISPECIES: FecR domain-containing protein [Pseudomonas]MCH7299124.1 FecR domain-containing protein [Pseudomonas capeferrum]MDD2065080.1 FecR domain-containing protein [Pseudomonas sp. 25571]MDD2131439.1 FecR domain-containing protein [Pseudomonas sp. 17391]UDU83914.1 FecR domain-containing protein [Pseudomonas sp. HN2-3]